MAKDAQLQAHAILETAIHEHKPSRVFAMFSGGYDSLCTTHVTLSYLAKRYPCLPRAALHINTGIEETRRFVYLTSHRYQWPLKEYSSGEKYENIVLREGFPGPAYHKLMYILLKERALDAVIREYKQHMHDRILLVTGVRKEESVKRMGYVRPIQRDDCKVWVAPLLEWKKTDILDYVEEQRLPHNEVVDLLHLSGECCCGSFAQRGELAMISAFFPHMGNRLRALQERVSQAGFPWGWEERPPRWWVQVKQGQQYLPGFTPLCASCDARFEHQ